MALETLVPPGAPTPGTTAVGRPAGGTGPPRVRRCGDERGRDHRRDRTGAVAASPPQASGGCRAGVLVVLLGGAGAGVDAVTSAAPPVPGRSRRPPSGPATTG